MLTDLELKSLAPELKPYKRSDAGGLYIHVQPNGRKVWRLGYRFDNKQKTLTGGHYPDVSLRAARDWRGQMKAHLKLGRDPAEEIRREKAPPPLESETGFEAVAREWLEIRKLSWTPRYAALVLGRLEADIFPVIGKRDLREVLPRDILQALRTIEARGAIEMARRVKNHCSEIFRYAIPDGRCDTDPCRDLNPALAKPRPVRHRAKVSARDLPAFFAGLHADGGSELTHLALRWTMLTMVRSQETRFAEWTELEGLDGPKPIWRISPDRMKMRSEHIVPLSRQAIALLKDIYRINIFLRSGNVRLGRYLFPVASARSKVISENRMLDVMYRLGLRGKATVHGFRGLASTVLNESSRFEPDWIEHQLAHQPRGVRAAYNAARYLDHRRPMMQWWADYLDAAEAKGIALSEQASPLMAGPAYRIEGSSRKPEGLSIQR